MAERLEDQVKETKQQIIHGIMDSGEKKLRKLQELTNPLPITTPPQIVGRAIDELSDEGVIPYRQTPKKSGYDFDNNKAGEKGYV